MRGRVRARHRVRISTVPAPDDPTAVMVEEIVGIDAVARFEVGVVAARAVPALAAQVAPVAPATQPWRPAALVSNGIDPEADARIEAATRAAVARAAVTTRAAAIGALTVLGVTTIATVMAVARAAGAMVETVARFLESGRLLRAQVTTIFVGGVTLAGVALLTQVGPATVRGDVVVTGGPFALNEPCAGSGRFVAATEGGAIEVWEHANDSSIGQGVLGPGRAASATECWLPFRIENVRRGLDQYTLVLVDRGGEPVAWIAGLGDRELLRSVEVRAE